MRYIRYFVLAAIAIALITVAIANRGPLTIRLLPAELEGLFGLSWQITLPAFLILLVAVLVGVLLGFVWEWVREHRYRAEAVAERKERQRLEREVKKAAPEATGGGDDVLALLESR
ncbi:MAG: DUF1049 domain-containing protein [Silicimonas sp.]|nr:DUF1049 domain-containing protein [Silicimonas sp.]NNF92613.1 DUF1049 domain-containing protein [Boseongicola sp.]RZW01938.1 MAG: DUF1049 domain-containing protein [Paracoccaceae bacterium]MBT8426257.1 DUF1049 domain-containing protein [Silicimonas sp.]NND18729.1 DUF1049 domain-containing protein [Silicimonas sp.]